MPRMPLYSGPIASAVMPQSFTPRDTSILAQGGEDLLGGAAGGVLRRLIMGPQADPNAALVRQRDAETALKSDELKRSQAAETARTGLSGVMDELMYRTGRDGGAGPTDRMDPVIDEQPYVGPVELNGAPKPDEDALLRAASANALRQSLGAGADNKQTTPIMQAFALAMGDDNEIARVNAALEGKYLGDNQSVSVEGQVEKREDEQRQDMEKADMADKTARYGFNLASTDRRYNTDVDAGAQRRGQDITSSNTRRGQDMTDARASKGETGSETVQTEQLFEAKPGRPAKKATWPWEKSTPAVAARPETKVVTTKKVPVRVAPGGAAPAKADPLGIR